MPTNKLAIGTAEKTAGDKIRIAMDFGDEPLLINGATIVAHSITTSGSGAPTIGLSSLDYAYQISAVVEGGSPGTYSLTFMIELDDADNSVISRDGVLKIY